MGCPSIHSSIHASVFLSVAWSETPFLLAIANMDDNDVEGKDEIEEVEIVRC